MGMERNNEHRITAEAFTAVIGNMVMGTSALLSSRTTVAEKRGKYPGNTRTVPHWLHMNRTDQGFPNSRSEDKFQVVILHLQEQGILFMHTKVYNDGLKGQSLIPGMGKKFVSSRESPDRLWGPTSLQSNC
jgi:hypothetical protein